MNTTSQARPAPPDQAQRERALNVSRSVLVQAPAGSGKTDLLTRRFLRLLAAVDDPSQIVAITFTKAAAAEMRHRILSELENAAARTSSADDEFSMEALATRALHRSRTLGWNLIDLPAQLRITTIDAFCREIAIRQPLLSSLGSGLDVSEQPDELYREAAQRTLQQLGDASRRTPGLQSAIELLLLWRDNNWQELENQLVLMLAKRDRWMQEFWLRDFTGDDEALWSALRERLERPFARAVAEALARVEALLARVPGACEQAHELARFACKQTGNALHRELAELAEFPCGPFHTPEELDSARAAFECLATLLLTNEGTYRQSITKANGFPTDYKREKLQLQQLIRNLEEIDGLAAALHAVRCLPPARCTEEDWQIVRAIFTLLHYAAGELRVAFAETGVVDFVEVAQIAQSILEGEGGHPSDAALSIADNIHHLLVDEFQDTSRRQHKLVGSLIAAWPDTAGRTLFVVGDPMQSIYFFRDADAELFPRVQMTGLELPNADPHLLDCIQLASNFRTVPELVERLNIAFEAVFDVNDSSQITFCASRPARHRAQSTSPCFDLHLAFMPQLPTAKGGSPESIEAKNAAIAEREAALEAQTAEIVAMVRNRLSAIERARLHGEKYRVAILGRSRAVLAPIARALRDAAIPFRAVELEQLADRPEVLDALALARALFHAEDRAAWLGVLRAPWCGLRLDELHTLTSADDPAVLARPIPLLLRERASLLSREGQRAVERVLNAMDDAIALRAAQPALTPGTWLQQVWLRVGGSACVNAAAHANLDLLWRCLDQLPNSDSDFTGPALNAALAKLTAQPDPAADADHGVHLMTIHKSKGLEFEVVIVPELQARSAVSTAPMFSWLERGLASPGDGGEITEFLIAPFQPKGSDRGKAREWVDREYRAREAQETRRILYVAATRAREELHLFARPSYKLDHGTQVLCEPAGSLLSTAWPALEEEVRARFEAWKSQPAEGDVEQLAAAADNLLVMPTPAKPALLRRLPADFTPPPVPALLSRARSTATDTQAYARHEGDIESRILGSSVHLLLQEFARLRLTKDDDSARASLASVQPQLVAQARAAGLSRGRAADIASRAIEVAVRATQDPTASWILAPHPGGASEVCWTGVVDGTMRTVQADRVFRAGVNPSAPGDQVWWIIDYKTVIASQANASAALPALRKLFAPQLDLYAKVLRKLHGPQIEIRLGLYYPRMLQFDFWEP